MFTTPFVLLLVVTCYNIKMIATLPDESIFVVTKDWIMDVNASRIVGTSYSVSVPSQCTQCCLMEPDCFAVNVLIQNDTGGYTCQLLAGVSSVYSYVYSSGAFNYRKPCKSFPGTSYQTIGDQNNGVKYVLVDDQATYLEAIDTCQDNGMQFVTIETAEEFDTIIGSFIIDDDIYVGAYEINTTDTYHWINNNLLLSYDRWHAGQPDNSGSDQPCVIIKKDVLLYRDGTCGQHHDFICECPYWNP